MLTVENLENRETHKKENKITIPQSKNYHLLVFWFIYSNIFIDTHFTLRAFCTTSYCFFHLT